MPRGAFEPLVTCQRSQTAWPAASWLIAAIWVAWMVRRTRAIQSGDAEGGVDGQNNQNQNPHDRDAEDLATSTGQSKRDATGLGPDAVRLKFTIAVPRSGHAAAGLGHSTTTYSVRLSTTSPAEPPPGPTPHTVIRLFGRSSTQHSAKTMLPHSTIPLVGPNLATPMQDF